MSYMGTDGFRWVKCPLCGAERYSIAKRPKCNKRRCKLAGSPRCKIMDPQPPPPANFR